MTKTPRTFRWGPLAVATAAMLASIWVFGWIAEGAGAQGTIDHSDLEHSHGFSGPGDVANWPPRPNSAATDLVPIEGFADAQPSFTARAMPAPAPMSDELLAALGTDWIHVSSSPERTGKDDTRPAEETYFSRDLNQTVIVYGMPAGPQVSIFPASQIQPVVTAGETVEATALGRAWLIEQGLDGVGDLEGFGIRALDDGELYPVRMVYITYATSWFDDPQYMALVDMSNLVVIDGGAL